MPDIHNQRALWAHVSFAYHPMQMVPGFMTGQSKTVKYVAIWRRFDDQPGPEESNPMFYSLITRSSQSCLVCRFGPRWQNVNMNHDSAASSFLSSKCVHSHQCILSRTPGDISICDETRCLFQETCGCFELFLWRGKWAFSPGDLGTITICDCGRPKLVF